MICKNKGGFFGSRNTPRETRIGLFYGVCIPVRICLGLAVWYLSQINETWNKVIPIIVLLLAISGIYNNYTCLEDKTVWWNRKVHMFSNIGLILMSILSLSGVIKSKYIAIVLWLDVLWGFFDSLFHYI